MDNTRRSSFWKPNPKRESIINRWRNVWDKIGRPPYEQSPKPILHKHLDRVAFLVRESRLDEAEDLLLKVEDITGKDNE